MLKIDNDFTLKEISFSKEANLCLDDYIDSQKLPYLGLENPTHSRREASHYILSPYFFNDENGNSVTINGEHHRGITDYFERN